MRESSQSCCRGIEACGTEVGRCEQKHAKSALGNGASVTSGGRMRGGRGAKRDAEILSLEVRFLDDVSYGLEVEMMRCSRREFLVEDK